MNSNIKKVFWFYFILFVVMIIYLLNFTFFDSKDIIGNPYNPRVSKLENVEITRGNILDKNGKILATTKNGERIYPFKNLFSHIVGYNSNEKSGIEVKYNFDLQRLDNEILQRLKKLSGKSDSLLGNSVVLTLDADLQAFVKEKLGERKGSVVVLNSKTGEVLSMVSYPDFNPQTINENISNLRLEEENAPLLNRSTQGLYPPGSVFKIIVATAFMEKNPDWASYTHVCKGEYTYKDKSISCYNNTVHNEVNLESALALSCNSFFASLSEKIAINDLKDTAKKFLFNDDFEFSLEHSTPSFNLNDDANLDEILQTFIGQGKTLTTPLHTAMIGAIIANNGVLMKPYILDSIINYDGKTISKTNPTTLKTVLSLQTSTEIRNMLEKVVEEGTGKKAQNDSVSISGKTGTAEVENKEDHTWFLGIAPAENPSIVISVLLENSGKSNVVELSKDVLKKALNIN